MKPITVIIVNRETESPYTTLCSLSLQSDLLDIVVVYDEGKGANFARNRGAALAESEYLLFSDNDIEWEPDAIESLYRKLSRTPECGYCYGWYEMEGEIYCNTPFDPKRLLALNYISTMSLIRRKNFSGFDESLQRLQDWDCWLTMLENGIQGIYCNQKIFTTTKREGITFGNGISWEEARKIVARKHGLLQ
jgi:glycosyltransferase involved in cell wall biosynthesis